MQFKSFLSLQLSLIALCFTTSASANIVEEFDDRDAWLDEVTQLGNVSTVNFVGYPKGTIIDDQYADLGVIFGNDEFVNFTLESPQLPDGFGLHGGKIIITFFEPQSWFGADRADLASGYQIYDGDTLLFEGLLTLFSDFGGVISDKPFDRIILDDPSDEVSLIDNIYFGAPLTVPAPGALLILLGGLGVTSWGRRRTAQPSRYELVSSSAPKRRLREA